jgi:hypothetical protein
MSKFVSFYHQVVQKKRSLRDDIEVRDMQLPGVVRQELLSTAAQMKTLVTLKKRDTLTALDRLQKLQAQIAKQSKN